MKMKLITTATCMALALAFTNIASAGSYGASANTGHTQQVVNELRSILNQQANFGQSPANNSMLQQIQALVQSYAQPQQNQQNAAPTIYEYRILGLNRPSQYARINNIRIHWQNIQGLGSVSGTVNFDGDIKSFTGQNSRPGYLWIQLQDGSTFSLNKSNTQFNVVWTGVYQSNGSSINVRLEKM